MLFVVAFLRQCMFIPDTFLPIGFVCLPARTLLSVAAESSESAESCPLYSLLPSKGKKYIRVRQV